MTCIGMSSVKNIHVNQFLHLFRVENKSVFKNPLTGFDMIIIDVLSRKIKASFCRTKLTGQWLVTLFGEIFAILNFARSKKLYFARIKFREISLIKNFARI